MEFLAITGFKRHVADDQCIDIDECIVGDAVACGHRQVCKNSHGSYSCQCEMGFAYNEIDECEDINECDSPACGPNSECENTEGSFSCSCQDGFQNNVLTEFECENIDECILNPCSAHAYCVDNPGSFACIYPKGFELAEQDVPPDHECIDIDKGPISHTFQCYFLL